MVCIIIKPHRPGTIADWGRLDHRLFEPESAQDRREDDSLTIHTHSDPAAQTAHDDQFSTQDQSSDQQPTVSLPMYPQDSRYIQVEVIGGVILTIVIAVLSLIGLSVLWVSLGFGLIWYSLAACAVGLIGLLTWLTFAWPRIEFKHYHWRLDDQSLEIHRGVWFQHRISVPLGRVQHADVSQGPLLRRFDLGKLTIHTAGTVNAQIELDGLSHDVAIKLRDRLVQQAQSRVVT
jgi:uncharacterized protein